MEPTEEIAEAEVEREGVILAVLLALVIPALLTAANLDLRARPAAEPVPGPIASAAMPAATPAAPAPEQDAPPPADAAAPDDAATGASPRQDPAGEDEPAKPQPPGVLPVRFSLASPGSGPPQPRARSDGSIEVRKTLVAGGRAIGSIDIIIEGGAELLVSASDARELLRSHRRAGESAAERLPDQGLVSFATLRDIGLDLRYSPVEDVVMLRP